MSVLPVFLTLIRANPFHPRPIPPFSLIAISFLTSPTNRSMRNVTDVKTLRQNLTTTLFSASLDEPTRS
jgi:hypothetical protein